MRAEMQDKIDQLEEQHTVDRDLIAHLETEGLIDRELIVGLEAQSATDREKITSLEIALITARRIGAAMGILMARQQFTDKQALDALLRASQQSHRPLGEIANVVIYTGALNNIR